MNDFNTSVNITQVTSYEVSVMMGSFVIIIAVIGAVGNGLVIISLVMNSKLRNHTSAFLFSLAISDLSYCIIVLPLVILDHFSGAGNNTKEACAAKSYLGVIFSISSMFHLGFLSLYRYIAIVHSAKCYTKIHTIAYILIISSWILPVLLSLPSYIASDKVLRCELSGRCNFNSGIYPPIFSTISISIFFTLFLNIFFSYRSINSVLRLSRQELSTIKGKNSSNSFPNRNGTLEILKRRELKMTKMMIVVLICFVITFLPSLIFSSIRAVYEFNHTIKYIIILYTFSLISWCGLCLNPIIYAIMHVQYRRTYVAVLSFNSCKKKTKLTLTSRKLKSNIILQQFNFPYK